MFGWIRGWSLALLQAMDPSWIDRQAFGAHTHLIGIGVVFLGQLEVGLLDGPLVGTLGDAPLGAESRSAPVPTIV